MGVLTFEGLVWLPMFAAWKKLRPQDVRIFSGSGGVGRGLRKRKLSFDS